MLARSMLALCAVAVVEATTPATVTNINRDRRSTFLDIIKAGPRSESSYKFPVLPVELPIQLGGHGGVNLPVLVLPVPVPVYTKSDSCEAHQTTPAPVEKEVSPQYIIPPYVASRFHDDIQSVRKPAGDQPTSQQLTTNTEETLDDSLNENPYPFEGIPESAPPHKSASRHPKGTTNAPPTRRPASDYVTGSLFPHPPPPRKPTNRPPKLVTTNPSSTTESTSNYVTGSIFPDSPPRKIPSRHHTESVIPDAPANSEPERHYVTGSLFPDSPPRKITESVIPDAPANSERESHEVTGALIPDPDPPRKLINKDSKSAWTAGNHIPSNPYSRFNLGTGDKKIGFTLSQNREPIDYFEQRDEPENFNIPNQQQYNTSHDSLKVINKEQYEHLVEDGQIPYSEGRGQIFATTAELIQSFRKESPNAPELPAVIPKGWRFPDRIPPTEPDATREATIPAPSPPRPDFGRSLRLRIDLAVPRSDYTEVYDIEWHAESNTARSVIEGGTTVFYRVPLLDGRLQFLKVQEDRLNGSSVRRCTMSPLLPATPADKAFPGLPDLSLFHFVGYTSVEGWSLVECWRHFVVGKPGEGGAARGESLNVSHNFFMYRDGGDAMPLKYTVVIHSSVLGPACDSYTHRYRLLQEPTAPMLPDTTQCDVTEELKEDRRQRRDVGGLFSGLTSGVRDYFNPIGDFLGLTRPAKYDSLFDEFKHKFKRNYRDLEEEAVRKQQFIKTNRFVDAGNRIASSFEMGINFVADRVKEEVKWLFGAVPPPPGAAPPPGARPEFDFAAAIEMAKDLPEEFNWKDRGFESPVHNQGTKCMSCWAFAVAAATEGALYNKTNQIVPLSAQTMVDCGEPYKAMGCAGGWPLDAFGYVQDRGLPTWEEYTYEAEELMCKDSSVSKVTHISEYHMVAESEEALKVALYHRAPTVVVLRANTDSFLNLIGKGLLDDTKCSKLNDHAVLAVGWGSEDGDHFNIKNSWGEGWGDKGYARVSNDYCGITDYMSYPVVKKSAIDRADLRDSAV